MKTVIFRGIDNRFVFVKPFTSKDKGLEKFLGNFDKDNFNSKKLEGKLVELAKDFNDKLSEMISDDNSLEFYDMEELGYYEAVLEFESGFEDENDWTFVITKLAYIGNQYLY